MPFRNAANNGSAAQRPQLAKTRVTVCMVKAYTDASTTILMTTFNKSSIALRTLLCLYSRYVINCLRKVSETTSPPILWISGHRSVALLDDLLPWFGQRRSQLGARHVTIVVLINKKTLPIRVTSTCGVGQKRSQREAHLQAKVSRGSFHRKRPRYFTLGQQH